MEIAQSIINFPDRQAVWFSQISRSSELNLLSSISLSPSLLYFDSFFKKVILDRLEAIFFILSIEEVWAIGDDIIVIDFQSKQIVHDHLPHLCLQIFSIHRFIVFIRILPAPPGGVIIQTSFFLLWSSDKLSKIFHLLRKICHTTNFFGTTFYSTTDTLGRRIFPENEIWIFSSQFWKTNYFCGFIPR